MSGILSLTFDDRNFQGWIKAIPVFRKYHAHATFFTSDIIDAEAVECLTELAANGHSIGLHTVSHADAPPFFAEKGAELYFREQIQPQLDACKKAGLNPRSFGYPNNARTPETDAFLLKHFNHLRAGMKDAEELEFMAIPQLKKAGCLHGTGIGEYYHTVVEDELKKVIFAAENDRFKMYFSHNIAPEAASIHMPLATLEALLQCAADHDMRVLGFDELPR